MNVYDRLTFCGGLGGGCTGSVRAITNDATTKIVMVRTDAMVAVSMACSFRRRAVCR